MDDLYILSINDTALDDAKSFLGDHQHVLKLNEAKCSTISLENIRRDGFEMLGTVLGAREARERFINTKTDKLSAQLDHLHNLPHQHALQLLLRCYQQDLRHLQRSLATEDLPNAWKRLDDRLYTEIKRLRGAEDGSFNGQLIAHLPARLGGLGPLNHQDISPHARAASQAASIVLVSSIFGLDNPQAQDNPQSQRERCQTMWDDQRDSLLAKFDEKGRKAVVEAASPLGRLWLSVIPFFQPLRLSDYEISTGLHSRTLQHGSRMVCNFCGDPNELGHDEVCGERNRWTVKRHDAVKRALGGALASVDSTEVTMEPGTEEGRRRNDLQVRGRAMCRPVDYDIKIYSLLDRDAHKTTTLTKGNPLGDHITSQALRW